MPPAGIEPAAPGLGNTRSVTLDRHDHRHRGEGWPGARHPLRQLPLQQVPDAQLQFVLTPMSLCYSHHAPLLEAGAIKGEGVEG